MAQQPATTQEEVQRRAAGLLGQVAGYIGFRTIHIGLQHGLFQAMAQRPEGAAPEELAAALGLDPFYVGVWCRSAYAAEVLEHRDGRYRLPPAVATLLLDRESPAWSGGLFQTMSEPEIFERFSERLRSGERLWWDQVSSAFIQAVSQTGRPFYTRLLGAGLAQVPGLTERLEAGADVLELACGVGDGLLRLAAAYPASRFLGIDGDAYSLSRAEESARAVGLGDRAAFRRSTLEDLDVEGAFDVALINISMHECRDIERVAGNVRRALRPGGTFVISDFAFPTSLEGCRTVPGRLMCGVQFFEALIDDQLLPTEAFVALLGRHGFRDVGAFDLTPLHAVTYGTA